jgi:protein transport protein SEC24
MQEDQRQRSAVFCTNQRGLVPPLVTTNFITQDQGNCSPRYMRASMYSVPATIDMMKQVQIYNYFNYRHDETGTNFK